MWPACLRPLLQSARLRSSVYHQTICAVKSHLARLQYSKPLEKHETKETRLFALNVYLVRIFIKFYTYSNNSQSL